MNRAVFKVFSLIFLIFIGGSALWTWASLKYVYASGERAGYVQKFSRKGWIFKTWEGELAMVNLPGTAPEKFFFTVPSENVARRVESVLGRKSSLRYEQHVGIPFRAFGDTPYFVTDVRLVDEEDPVHGAPPVN